MSRTQPHKIFFGALLLLVVISFGSEEVALSMFLAGSAGLALDPIIILLAVGAGALGRRYYIGVPIAAGMGLVIALLLHSPYLANTVLAMVFWAFAGDLLGELTWRRRDRQAAEEPGVEEVEYQEQPGRGLPDAESSDRE